MSDIAWQISYFLIRIPLALVKAECQKLTKVANRRIYMAITRWSPLSRVIAPGADFWDDDFFPALREANVGGMEVYETEKQVVVKVNVAGVPENDIDITFEKGMLFINAQKAEEETDEKRNYYSRSSQQYSYRIAVPGEIDLNEEPEASVDNGLLTVTFAKSKKAMPRKLQVKAKQK